MLSLSKIGSKAKDTFISCQITLPLASMHAGAKNGEHQGIDFNMV